MSVACEVCQRVGHVVCKLCRLMCVACMCLREECQRAYVIDGSGKDIIVLLYYIYMHGHCFCGFYWSKFFFINSCKT